MCRNLLLCELFWLLPLGGNIAAIQENAVHITAERSKMNGEDCDQSSFFVGVQTLVSVNRVIRENPELNGTIK